MQKTLSVLIFLFLTNIVFSQEVYELKFAKKEKLHLATIAFNNIEVIDSRFDTTTVYTNEDGRYPRVYCKFLPSTASVIQQTLMELIAPVNKTDSTILINIKQLRIPNKQYIKRRGGRHKFYLSELRNKLLFIADLYHKTGNNKYRKFASVDKKDIMLGIDFKKSTILKDLIKATITPQAQLTLTDTSEISLQEIIAGVEKEWTNYPIMGDTNYATGLFITFDDFKNNIKNNIPFKLTPTSDSIYTFVFTDTIKISRRLLPFVVADQGYLFVQLFKDKYLRLEKKAATFYFVVPCILPNMYDLMSMESINSEDLGYSGSSSGSLLLDLAALTAAGVIDQISKNSRIKKIKQNRESEKYRYVAIDMYSGDFIF